MRPFDIHAELRACDHLGDGSQMRQVSGRQTKQATDDCPGVVAHDLADEVHFTVDVIESWNQIGSHGFRKSFDSTLGESAANQTPKTGVRGPIEAEYDPFG